MSPTEAMEASRRDCGSPPYADPRDLFGFMYGTFYLPPYWNWRARLLGFVRCDECSQWCPPWDIKRIAEMCVIETHEVHAVANCPRCYGCYLHDLSD